MKLQTLKHRKDFVLSNKFAKKIFSKNFIIQKYTNSVISLSETRTELGIDPEAIKSSSAYQKVGSLGSSLNIRMNKAFKKAKFIIANSKYTKDLAVSMGLDKNKIHIIKSI